MEEKDVFAFSALEIREILTAIGRWPMQTRGQRRWLDDLEAVFAFTPEEAAAVGYVELPGVLTPQGLTEQWGLGKPMESLDRKLDDTLRQRLLRVLTAHDVHGWRRTHYKQLILPIVERLGGEPTD